MLELRASSWAGGGSPRGGRGLIDGWAVVVGVWGAGAGCADNSGGGVVFGMALCVLVCGSPEGALVEWIAGERYILKVVSEVGGKSVWWVDVQG